MANPAARTARGYEEPVAVQFSIFLANRVGQLKELLDAFTQKEVHVLGLSIIDSTDWAVVRVICSDPNSARAAMNQYRLPYTESAVLLVELPLADDLARICQVLLGAEVNVHFAWPLAINRNDHPVMVFHVDDTSMAMQALNQAGFELLGGDNAGEGSP